MAENISVKCVVDGIDFAKNPITKYDDIATAEWDEQPLTLRDDVVELVEGDPTEDEVFSHEEDSPVYYDVAGVGVTATGSFIEATPDQLVTLLGGEKQGTAFIKSSKKIMVERPMRFRFKNGGYAIIPRARGYVLLNMGVGRDGRVKFPFSFKALAQPGFDCDVIIEQGQ